jgi:glycosyltransferase involved in cell wall biosynthesis
VDPLNTKSIADGIERVLDDRELAEQQRLKGLQQSLKFDWDSTAARTLDFYRRVLES